MRTLERTSGSSGARAPGRREAQSLSRLFKMSFKEAAEEARVFLEHFRNPSRTDYAVQFAATVLNYGPAPRFVSALEQLAEKTSEENAWAAGRMLCPFVEHLVHGLLLASDGEFIDCILRSNVAFARALGGAALLRLILKKPDEIGTLFLALESLPRSEQLETCCRWASGLRVDANRAGKEGELTQSVRLRTFEKIRELWPKDIDQLGLVHVMKCLSGPIPGNWAKSTTDELLLPLVQSGQLQADLLFEAWNQVLAEKLGLDTQSEESRQKIQFDAGADVELSVAWARTYAAASVGCRSRILQTFRPIRKGATITLRQPFMRSRDYDKYSSALQRILWLEMQFGLAYLQTHDPELHEIYADLATSREHAAVDATHLKDTELVQLAKKIAGEIGENRARRDEVPRDV